MFFSLKAGNSREQWLRRKNLMQVQRMGRVARLGKLQEIQV